MSHFSDLQIRSGQEQVIFTFMMFFLITQRVAQRRAVEGCSTGVKPKALPCAGGGRGTRSLCQQRHQGWGWGHFTVLHQWVQHGDLGGMLPFDLLECERFITIICE